MNFKFDPFPLLKTERLVLRQTDAGDKEAVHFLRSDQEVNRYIKRPGTTNLSEAAEFIKRITRELEQGESISWSISLREEHKMIGSICLWNFSADHSIAEVGYSLHPENQQQGIMSEALASVLEFGFNTLHFETIEAYTHTDNTASTSMLTKRYFQLIEGKKDEDDQDNIIFAINNPKNYRS